MPMHLWTLHTLALLEFLPTVTISNLILQNQDLLLQLLILLFQIVPLKVRRRCLLLHPLHLKHICVIHAGSLRHNLGQAESIELVHEIFPIGKVQFKCEFCLEVRCQVHMFKRLVCGCDGVVDKRDYLIEFFVLLLLDSTPKTIFT